MSYRRTEYHTDCFFRLIHLNVSACVHFLSLGVGNKRRSVFHVEGVKRDNLYVFLRSLEALIVGHWGPLPSTVIDILIIV